jgi:hypothetical protein
MACAFPVSQVRSATVGGSDFFLLTFVAAGGVVSSVLVLAHCANWVKWPRDDADSERFLLPGYYAP